MPYMIGYYNIEGGFETKNFKTKKQAEKYKKDLMSDPIARKMARPVIIHSPKYPKRRTMHGRYKGGR